MSSVPDRPLPVVLLHSIGTDRHLWDGVVPMLKAEVVLTPESAGHGSAGGPGPVDIDGWVRDLESFLDSEGLDVVDLVGLSMGGVQALAFAGRRPERVRGLVVADSFAVLPAEVAAARVEGIEAAIRDNGMGAYAETYLATTLVQPIDDGWRERLRLSIAGMHPDAYLASARVCFGADVTAELSSVTAATTVLVGSEDQKTPRPLSEFVAATVPGAVLREVPGAGHLACVDAPAAFAALVNRALDAAAPAAAGAAPRSV